MDFISSTYDSAVSAVATRLREQRGEERRQDPQGTALVLGRGPDVERWLTERGYRFRSAPIAGRPFHPAGYAVTPAVVMVKGGYWTKTVGVLDRGKIQSVFVVQPLFDRMLGLGRVVVRVAGTEMQLPAVELSVALGVLAQLRPAEQRAQPS